MTKLMPGKCCCKNNGRYEKQLLWKCKSVACVQVLTISTFPTTLSNTLIPLATVFKYDLEPALPKVMGRMAAYSCCT